MFDSVWQDVKREFSSGNMLTKIIIVNILVFVIISLVRVSLFLGNGGVLPNIYNDIVNFIAIAPDWKELLFHPWTLITSSFLHLGAWHLLWNMLMLYWFGRIVGDLIGDQRVLPLYLLSAIFTSFIFFTVANTPIGEHFGHAMGASGAVMAFAVASATIAPNYIFNLMFIGPVRIKYVVMVIVFMDIIATTGQSNVGGAFGHLGGAFFGYLFISQLNKGNDLSLYVNNLLEKIQSLFKRKEARKPFSVSRNKNFKTSNKPHAVSETDEAEFQDKLDLILEKINKRGYDNLSKEEKEFLFDASKK